LAQSRGELQFIAEELWRNGAGSVGEAVDRFRSEWRVSDDEDVEVPLEGRADLEVDGSPRTFRLLRRAHSWLASCEQPDVWIKIEADGFDLANVAIVTISDLTPYVDGARAILLPSGTVRLRS
jgi:hypothetical protein